MAERPDNNPSAEKAVDCAAKIAGTDNSSLNLVDIMNCRDTASKVGENSELKGNYKEAESMYKIAVNLDKKALHGFPELDIVDALALSSSVSHMNEARVQRRMGHPQDAQQNERDARFLMQITNVSLGLDKNEGQENLHKRANPESYDEIMRDKAKEALNSSDPQERFHQAKLVTQMGEREEAGGDNKQALKDYQLSEQLHSKLIPGGLELNAYSQAQDHANMSRVEKRLGLEKAAAKDLKDADAYAQLAELEPSRAQAFREEIKLKAQTAPKLE